MIFALPRPEWIVAASAALWGLFWIPLRAFEQGGLTPGWATVSQFIAPCVCLLPFVIVRLWQGKPSGLANYQSGIWIGAAFALYCESLLLTDVVRALVLFYVMPAWGTLAEVRFMGRRFTFWRGLALLLSIFGMLTIVSGDENSMLSFNLGDAMALLSGIAFTIGAMRVRLQQSQSVMEQLFAFFFYGALIAIILALLPIVELDQPPESSVIIELLPWLIVMSIVFLIPVMAGIYWGSTYVDPGRLGLLLQLEAVVGITSAAIFAGEPFGLKEFVGSVFVLCAGAAEVFGNTRRIEVTPP